MMRYVILGLLHDGRARHGYALMKEYREKSGRTVSIGNVYRELQRLREEGLVRAGRNPAGADPRRMPYEITEAGSGEFGRWLGRPGGGCLDTPDDEYSLRAFFVWLGRGESGQRVFADWSEELRSRTRELSRRCAETGIEGSNSSNGSFWLDRRLRHLAVDLEFIDTLRAARESAPVGDCGVGVKTSHPRRRLGA